MEISLILFLIACGITFIGTHKRTSAFPFTYDQVPYITGSYCFYINNCLLYKENSGYHVKKIKKDGPRMAYFASQRVKTNLHTFGKNSTKVVELVCVAFRSGFSKVGLVITNWSKIGKNKWDYITRSTKSIYTTSDDIEAFFNNKTSQKFKILTKSQRSSEWFILRSFSITSTTAFIVLKRLKRLFFLDKIRTEGLTKILKVLDKLN